MQEINTKIGMMEIVFLSRFQENCTCANSGRQVPSLLAQEPGIKPSSTTPWRVVIKSEHPFREGYNDYITCYLSNRCRKEIGATLQYVA